MTAREDSESQDVESLIRLVAAALAEWVARPCPELLFWVGVACGGIVGYSPSYCLEAGIATLREVIGRADGIDIAMRPDIDLLALNDLPAKIFTEP